MKKIYLILLILIFSISLNAKQDWKMTYWGNQNEAALRIQCIDSTDCIACLHHQNFCRLIQSTDGGYSWSILYDESNFEKPNYPLPYYINNMQYIDRNHLYIIYGDMGAIKRSSNRGKTWDTTYIQEVESLYHFNMLDSINGLVATSTKLFITSDGWKTYKLIPTIHAQISAIKMHSLKDFDVVRSVGVYGNIGTPDRFRKIYSRTNDAGLSWIHDSICNFYTDKLFFINRNLGWLAGSQELYIGDQKYDMLLKTSDGGVSWKLVYKEVNDLSFGLNDVAFYDTLNGIAVGPYGKVLRTTDGGTNWFREYLPDHPAFTPKKCLPFTMVVTYAGNVPICGTFGYGMYRLMEEGDGVVDDGSENSFFVSPNPAGDFITIKLGAINPTLKRGVDEYPEIQIFNTLGEKVLSASARLAVPLRINISALPKGMYFVKAGGETAKFVIE